MGVNGDTVISQQHELKRWGGVSLHLQQRTTQYRMFTIAGCLLKPMLSRLRCKNVRKALGNFPFIYINSRFEAADYSNEFK